jgi:NAD(P)-dependent dehydrogenase (short-subunit alcohol dehydrogenase family)
MADSLDEKVAIVTGGGSGIGAALCLELARRGAQVVVADIDSSDAKRVGEAIKANGGRAEARPADVSHEGDIQRLVEETAASHGRLDYMFSNAGIAIGGDARDLTLDQWRRVLDVDLYGVLYGALAAYQIMARQGSGHIVNVSSAAGLLPLPLNAPYSTAKHAVVGFSRSLRLEGAGLGVKVSVVCPGYVRTNIYQNAVVVNMPGPEAIRPPAKMLSAAQAAREILAGVARNQAVIVFPASMRVARRLYFFSPRVLDRYVLREVRRVRELRIATADG